MNKLIITPKNTIDSIRLQFSKQFPFLDIRCFKKMHAKKEGSAKKQMYPSETKLSECMNVDEPVTVSFNQSETVKQFEENIKTATGLNLQVFRKSGDIWLETTATDDWTLQQQNEEGKNSGIKIKEVIENADDHDMY